jgi:hypothetical protein
MYCLISSRENRFFFEEYLTKDEKMLMMIVCKTPDKEESILNTEKKEKDTYRFFFIKRKGRIALKDKGIISCYFVETIFKTSKIGNVISE